MGCAASTPRVLSEERKVEAKRQRKKEAKEPANNPYAPSRTKPEPPEVEVSKNDPTPGIPGTYADCATFMGESTLYILKIEEEGPWRVQRFNKGPSGFRLDGFGGFCWTQEGGRVLLFRDDEELMLWGEKTASQKAEERRVFVEEMSSGGSMFTSRPEGSPSADLSIDPDGSLWSDCFDLFIKVGMGNYCFVLSKTKEAPQLSVPGEEELEKEKLGSIGAGIEDDY
uniref:Uncharacterized protein n=1 Tax=Chromera velia CCMP2878 TaxID=1169474 RepID=A0A0G4IDA1_9ALVE|eukprot:Cvel_13324.t1-p1 / transcript=Cvel_13324.t1 / gene=Cvel_13324 / organism=Chromera_velia_CCMP2878 / gene_product=hypothetical protein / transcript_product=hypothetical protein / location=Cvel_scaffold904:41752-42426(+) / protein_length=225 / sequence_SO=supercontig / SO=protein_coding / is_pseudo=false